MLQMSGWQEGWGCGCGWGYGKRTSLNCTNKLTSSSGHLLRCWHMAIRIRVITRKSLSRIERTSATSPFPPPSHTTHCANADICLGFFFLLTQMNCINPWQSLLPALLQLLILMELREDVSYWCRAAVIGFNNSRCTDYKGWPAPRNTVLFILTPQDCVTRTPANQPALPPALRENPYDQWSVIYRGRCAMLNRGKQYQQDLITCEFLFCNYRFCFGLIYPFFHCVLHYYAVLHLQTNDMPSEVQKQLALGFCWKWTF